VLVMVLMFGMLMALLLGVIVVLMGHRHHSPMLA